MTKIFNRGCSTRLVVVVAQQAHFFVCVVGRTGTQHTPSAMAPMKRSVSRPGERRSGIHTPEQHPIFAYARSVSRRFFFSAFGREAVPLLLCLCRNITVFCVFPRADTVQRRKDMFSIGNEMTRCPTPPRRLPSSTRAAFMTIPGVTSATTRRRFARRSTGITLASAPREPKTHLTPEGAKRERLSSSRATAVLLKPARF